MRVVLRGWRRVVGEDGWDGGSDGGSDGEC